ncbi:MAG: ribosome small subunit-dependent GTPase A [Chloroflexi bacterium]|nr:ribosome small subunit-dependent GTPase A [Chloroflexota bacterium]
MNTSDSNSAFSIPHSGLIIKAQSGFFTVHTEHGNVVCKLRGRLKQKKLESDLATVGDRVTISLLDDGTGMIETVGERTRALTRRKPSPKGRAARGGVTDDQHESIIIANPDQAVFVFACAQPAPHLGMLDRFLVVAEANHIPPIICANKNDLVSPEESEKLFGGYRAIGYTVIYTSAITGVGVDTLRESLNEKISVLTGPSGVGKSSLLNAIQPQLGITVKKVSEATQKGRHTTVHPELIPLNGGGWVADTPGVRALALYDIDKYELDGYFRDIYLYVDHCACNNCTHSQESGCAVRAAVERGEIQSRRYESYLRIRAG